MALGLSMRTLGYLLLLIGAVGLIACGSTKAVRQDGPPSELIGTWVWVSSSQDHPEYYEETYFADGTYCSFTLDGLSASEPFSVERGTWERDGGFLHVIILEANNPARVMADAVNLRELYRVSSTELVSGYENGLVSSVYRKINVNRESESCASLLGSQN
jgi:hypothetical protein